MRAASAVPLLFLHTYISPFLRRLEDSAPTPAPARSPPPPDALARGFCLRIPPPLFVSETFSSARRTHGRARESSGCFSSPTAYCYNALAGVEEAAIRDARCFIAIH